MVYGDYNENCGTKVILRLASSSTSYYPPDTGTGTKMLTSDRPLNHSAVGYCLRQYIRVVTTACAKRK